MLQRSAIPDATQRRYLVLTCGFSRSQSQVRIRGDDAIDDAISLPMLFRHDETFDRRQLIAGVKRRCVTTQAAFAGKNFSTSLSHRVEFVRIRRWLERIQKSH